MHLKISHAIIFTLVNLPGLLQAQQFCISDASATSHCEDGLINCLDHTAGSYSKPIADLCDQLLSQQQEINLLGEESEVKDFDRQKLFAESQKLFLKYDQAKKDLSKARKKIRKLRNQIASQY